MRWNAWIVAVGAALVVGALWLVVGRSGLLPAGDTQASSLSFAGDPETEWERLGGTDDRVVLRTADRALEISIGDAIPEPAFNGVRMKRPMSLRRSAWTVRTDMVGVDVRFGVEAKFRATLSHDTDYASVEIGGARAINFVHKVSGHGRVHSIPFDAREHVFWRIRHEPSDLSLRWETSRDGRDWREHWRDTVGFNVNALRAELYGGTFEPVEGPGTARFLDFTRTSTAAPERAVGAGG
jgi:hypothetical protein